MKPKFERVLEHTVLLSARMIISTACPNDLQELAFLLLKGYEPTQINNYYVLYSTDEL